MMRAFPLWVALPLLFTLPAGAQPAATPRPLPALPRGELISRVQSLGEAGETYALYIPRHYDPRRPSPVLYILDARGRAELPARLFLAGAEKYGYLVASSYNSASDGPVQPTVNAMQAMWNDTHRRFAIDDRRIYVAGFSGTVRAACFMGLSVPGSLTGVIGAGAGFPYDRQPTAETSFLFYGTAGDRDFNFDEMQLLAGRMEGLGLPHRIETFDGTHQWMPEGLATAALAWLDLRAMRQGTRARDAAEIDALWQLDFSRARAFEAAGQPLAAWRLYRAMADDYAGLRAPVDLEGASRKTAELAASPALRAARREQEERRQADQRLLATAERALLAVTPERRPWSLGKVAAEMQLAELKARASRDGGKSEDAKAARRTLNAILAQTTFYLPQKFIERHEFALAAFFVELGREIRPEDPGIWYTLAAVHARGGLNAKALTELGKAADLGWTDAAQLSADSDFASLHGEAGWSEILARLQAAEAKPTAGH